MVEGKRYLALKDPTKSLHDTESGWGIAGDFVRPFPDPFPSPKVRDWFINGALVEVSVEDVRLFFSHEELDGMSKPNIIKHCVDWDVDPKTSEGKDKTKAQLIEDLMEAQGAF